MTVAPEVSVIFSTYCRNHGDELCPNFLERALQSILAQTFTCFELILIDDGSIDGSAEACKKHAESDSRIHYIRFELNSRLPALRYNQGISLSRGKWIAFMFDDDEWLPNALEDLYSQASSLPPIYGLVNAFVQYNHIQNGAYSTIFSNFGKESASFYKLFLENKLANNSVLVRRDVFDLVGGYDESRCMRRVCDWDLWLRIAIRYKFKVIPKTVAIVNQGLPDSLLNNIVLNQHLVYARQLMFFRKLALRKYYFPTSREQWLHFLARFGRIPFYLCIRYAFLYFGIVQKILRFLYFKIMRKGLRFVYRCFQRSKV